MKKINIGRPVTLDLVQTTKLRILLNLMMKCVYKFENINFEIPKITLIPEPTMAGIAIFDERDTELLSNANK